MSASRTARLLLAAGLLPLSGLLLAAGSPAADAVPVAVPTTVATVPGTPWEIAVLPTGGAFVVQRDGGIVLLDAQDRLVSAPALARTAIPDVRKLLGLALAPDFATSGLAYLYVAQGTDPDGGGPETGSNGIWRLKATGSTLTVLGQVFGGIGSDGNHDGGRMAFGPDGKLYVTTGDIHQPSRPQDLSSLNGKILRLDAPATGPLTAPADNPFVVRGGAAAYVWSLGHRHPQGLAFDAAGRLWETEHGPSGEQHGSAYPGGNNKTGRDELNLVVRGGNYGWPLVSGPDNAAGMIAPVAVAGDSPAWAPGDLAVGADGSLYAPFLAGSRLHRFDVRGGSVFAQGDHVTDQGRLRVAVAQGRDLLVAQDSGSGAKILRIPLGDPVPGGSDAATVPAPDPVPTAAPTPAPVTGPASVPAGPRPRAAVRELARAVARVLHRAGRQRLLDPDRRPLVAAAELPAGRTVVQVRVGSAHGPVVIEQRSRATATGALPVLLRPDRSGSARLRGADGGRLVVVVRHRGLDATTRAAVVRVRVDRGRG